MTGPVGMMQDFAAKLANKLGEIGPGFGRRLTQMTLHFCTRRGVADDAVAQGA